MTVPAPDHETLKYLLAGAVLRALGGGADADGHLDEQTQADLDAIARAASDPAALREVARRAGLATELSLADYIAAHGRAELALRRTARGAGRELSTASSSSKAGRWVTIGGVEGDDGKKHGGSPVYIENGRIMKGAPSLTGRRIDALKEAPEPESRQKELHREKEYGRAKWAKKARAEGIDPQHLHQLAAEMIAHDREHVGQRRHLLQRARKLLEHYGYHARALTTNLRSGRVEDEIPGLDVVADSLARSYPEQFAGHDPAERLKSLLTEGNPAPMSESDAYEQALEHLREHGGGGEDQGEGDVGGRPLWEDEGEGEAPFTLFGAATGDESGSGLSSAARARAEADLAAYQRRRADRLFGPRVRPV